MRSEGNLTASVGVSDTWPRLYFVPRVLAIHTSNPLSANSNAKDWCGGSSSHVIPSCAQFQNSYTHRITIL